MNFRVLVLMWVVVLPVGLPEAFGAAVKAAAVQGMTKARARKAGSPVAAAPAVPLPAEELERLASFSSGENQAEAVAAIRKLGDSGAPNAAAVLIGVLAVGTYPDVAAEAIASLQKLRDPKSISVLTLYAGNRNIPVRMAAIKALAAIDSDKVVGTLIERLGDQVPEVRAAAALALAARKEKRAVDRLLALVSRGDAGAAGPLGMMIDPAAIPRVGDLSGRVDDAVLVGVYGEFLKRADVPDRLRLDVVRSLARIPGSATTAALVGYLVSVPGNDGRPSKDEAQKVLEQKGSGR